MRNVRGIWLAAWVALSACGSIPDVVPVTASPADMHALAGTWDGEYEARVGEGRSGQIHFKLDEQRDTASGYVIMTFVPPRARGARRGTYPAAPRSEQLGIAFVRAHDGMISGELAPYSDPQCGCRLKTVFTGQQQGNRISGTFTTTHIDTHTVVRGRWWALRKID
jgi:hypothetical protein